MISQFIKGLLFFTSFIWLMPSHALTVVEIYQNAESAWAQGNLNESQNQFEQIENTYPLKANWSVEELKLFRLSFLRLAQLSEKRELREQRLIKAYTLSSDVGDEDHMFPKDLISDLHSMKGKLPLGITQNGTSLSVHQFKSIAVSTQKTWLAVGIAAVVVGLTYSLLNQKSETETTIRPSSVEGFK